MSETTPSAGPAPMPREEYLRLLGEATQIATGGGTLLLPTRDHLAALLAALTKAANERTELRVILSAIMVDTEQHELLIPDADLLTVASQGYSVRLESMPGRTLVRLLTPPQHAAMPTRAQ